MFGLLNYNASAAAAGATNVDLTAATDPDFSVRNGHYIFTEPYKLLAALPCETSVTRGRYQVPTWNAIGEATIFSANRSLNPPSNPQTDWYMVYPPDIPMNEEFQVQLSNNLGAATEIANCAIVIAPSQGYTTNIPRGRVILVRASFTVTPTLNAWSGGQAITLSQSLRGGSYSVIGAALQGTNATYFRIIFLKYKLYNGRKLRPGWFTQNAIGDTLNQQMDPWQMALGEWGRFFTFELPTVEVFGNVAGSITYQLFLWCIYLGESEQLADQGVSMG